MKFPPWLKVYGDKSYRGECNHESTDQIDFFSHLKLHHPELRRIAIHHKNEGKRSFGQSAYQKKDGSINPGASDIIIPSFCSFVCELKRKNHTKLSWQKGQIEYLEQAKNEGAFVCVALGFEGAVEALNDWLEVREKYKHALEQIAIYIEQNDISVSDK